MKCPGMVAELLGNLRVKCDQGCYLSLSDSWWAMRSTVACMCHRQENQRCRTLHLGKCLLHHLMHHCVCCTREVPDTIYGLHSNSGWIVRSSPSGSFNTCYTPAGWPPLLLLDSHSSHFNPEFIQQAVSQGVMVFCLPPNTTCVCQPLDSMCFHSLQAFCMGVYIGKAFWMGGTVFSKMNL